MGRPALMDLKCIISQEHLCIKFCTPNVVGVARGDQWMAQSCYMKACKQLGQNDLRVHTINSKAMKYEDGQLRNEPTFEVEEVQIDPKHPDQKNKDLCGAPSRTKKDDYPSPPCQQVYLLPYSINSSIYFIVEGNLSHLTRIPATEF
ncbi:unnamed protein product [Cuscuta europaea]|uniref:Uncharacterized protein n=1 Tax=Cuscuta europaea TaxID=41803 RepID=A0A9P0Z0J9_CUSEU|nr:unnamed protein product [Cuscuta europaea]